MQLLRQISAVSAMNFRNLRNRIGPSLVVVTGIGGTVGVLVSVLAMASGLLQAASGAGSPLRATVLHEGASSEATSGLSREDIELIGSARGVRRDRDNQPILSAEVIQQIPLDDGGEGKAGQQTVFRGVGGKFAALHPEFRVTEGTLFRSGVRELIVGQALQRRHAGLSVGGHIRIAGDEWAIVGTFTAESPSHDMELIGDAGSVLAAFDTGQFNSATLLLESAGAYDVLRTALVKEPRLSVQVVSERDFYLQQSHALAVILRVVAAVVGLIMAAGASFGALNAMYSALAARTREIATLRALGFASAPVLISIFAEALALATVGALCATALAWTIFHNVTVAQGNGGGGAIVYTLAITPELLLTGLIWAWTIGIVGALLPAIRAARLPIASALRTL